MSRNSSELVSRTEDPYYYYNGGGSLSCGALLAVVVVVGVFLVISLSGA